MRVIKGVVGVVLVLAGLVWIGQGLNMIKGSFMTGDPWYALLGLVVGLVGLWLLWSMARTGRAAGS
jgi:hypothetical protein